MLKQIVIASVLKPVDDVRSYKKFAQSIAKTNKYQLNIIGNGGKKESEDERIIFHPHEISSHSRLRRVIRRKLIFIQILKLKPAILIVSTHELLNVACLIKLLIGCVVVYDVQEDYAANLRYINPSFFKRIYSQIIRFKENISRMYVSQYWLAESCYSESLSFVKDRFLILENKAFFVQKNRIQYPDIRLLFSGTISNYSGVKNAINLFLKIIKKRPSTSLKIVGQIHDNKLLKQLFDISEKNKNVELAISKKIKSHDEIIEAIFSSNLGIIGYEENLVNRNKIPTKLYEYSRYQLPYIVSENTYWSKVSYNLGGSFPINFDDPNTDKIIDFFENFNTLFEKSYLQEATWEHESIKLIDTINTLLK